MKAIHPIGVVERRTGLSAHVIRVWERRYGAVAPERSEGNQRLYTDADIERLELLARAVANGESIGRIAHLPNEELQQLVQSGNRRRPGASSRAGNHSPETYAPQGGLGGRGGSDRSSRGGDGTGSGGPVNEPAIQDAIERIELSDNKGLRAILSSWLYTYGLADLVEQYVPELLTWIGEKWSTGDLQVHQEHMATETVRSFLGTVFDDLHSGDRDRTIITATPPGELHDIGALLSAITAATVGFDVVHLGPDVPFPELIGLALLRRPAAILLSFVFDSADERLVQGLQSLREMIDPEIVILIGGRSAGWYGNRLNGGGMDTGNGAGIRHMSSLSDLKETLTNLPAS